MLSCPPLSSLCGEWIFARSRRSSLVARRRVIMTVASADECQTFAGSRSPPAPPPRSFMSTWLFRSLRLCNTSKSVQVKSIMRTSGAVVIALASKAFGFSARPPILGCERRVAFRNDRSTNDNFPLALAASAGGFGGGGGASAGKNKKKSKNKKKGKSKGTGGSGSQQTNLFAPEGRIEHIRKRIEAADVSPVAKLALTKNSEGQLALDIDPNAIAVVDNFLGKELITAMRNEAESLLPHMVPSQSTRWDEETQQVVSYEKVGVLSTQIEGGEAGYKASPRLVEYIVTLTTHLSHKLNQVLPDAFHLSGQEQTNKLAVCLGDGSYYDKHIDNLGGGDAADEGDRRKLTALLYIQPPGSHEGQPEYPNEKIEDDPRGGYFRAYDVPEEGDVTCIAPRGDRLIMFWSDALVHDVSPSYAPNGEADRRWALTIWFIADKSGVIRATDAAIEERHFGSASIGKG